MPEPTPVALLSFIKDTFDWEELKTLCFQLYVQFDDLVGQTREAKARELIEFMRKRGRLPDLTAALARERPEQYRAAYGDPVERPAKPRIHARNPRQIFISHAHQDTKFAHRLANDLRRKDFEVWIAPDSISLGERWVEAINRALRESGIFLLVSTPDGVDSEWVQDETNYAIELAARQRVRFIRLDVEEADVPPLWTVRQHVSFRGDYEAGLKLLLPALEPSGAPVQPSIADAHQADLNAGKTQAQGPEIAEVEPSNQELPPVETAPVNAEVTIPQMSELEPKAEQRPNLTESKAATVDSPFEESKPKPRKRRKQSHLNATALTNPTSAETVVTWEKAQPPSENVIETTEQLQAMSAEKVSDDKPLDMVKPGETTFLERRKPSAPTAEPSTPYTERPFPSSTATVDAIVKPISELSLEEIREPASVKLENAQAAGEVNTGFSSMKPLESSMIVAEGMVSYPDQEPGYVPSEVNPVNREELPLPPDNNRAGYIALAILAILGGLVWLFSNQYFPFTGTRQETNSTPTREPQIQSITLPGGMEVDQVYVPAGSFMMGSEDDNAAERPVHEVTLDAFWIGRTEVTNEQYAACVADGACSSPRVSSSSIRNSYYGNPEYANYPVINVSWEDAAAYAVWAGGRLPTEAEWEYAARGPEGFRYPWGNETPRCELLNFRGCVGDTSEAGSYPDGASWIGALDMSGNVREWVNDWYGSGYYALSPAANPPGPNSGVYRALRGGSWDGVHQYSRTAYRDGDNPDNRNSNVGFRVAELLSDPDS